LVAGTYFYMIELAVSNKQLSGFVTIWR
jgi:hypothetical protein